MTHSPQQVADERRRSRRSVTFILSVVGVATGLMVLLALWVVVVPYDVSAPVGDGRSVSCNGTPHPAPTTPKGWEAACDKAKEKARTSRRNTALAIGAGAFVVATAVSTWPSRRLTGEELGPIR